MKLRHLAAGLLVGALALTACGREGSPGAESAGPTQTAAAGVAVEGSPTFAAMQQRGKVIMGVRSDQPGLGFQDATTGQYSGFDIEIARLVAAQLGFNPDQLEYKVVPSAAREDTIERGEIDYMVGTYTINDNRKQRVSFAGPYYVAGQSLLVRSDDTAITSKDTLKGKKVCSVTGSTPIQRVKEQQLTEREHRRVPDLQPVRRPAAQQPGRRGHHRRRHPQGLRCPAARQAEGRRRAVFRRALRHRPEQGRRRTAQQDQRHPRGRGGRRDLEADLRRDAGKSGPPADPPPQRY